MHRTATKDCFGSCAMKRVYTTLVCTLLYRDTMQRHMPLHSSSHSETALPRTEPLALQHAAFLLDGWQVSYARHSQLVCDSSGVPVRFSRSTAPTFTPISMVFCNS
eukprot:COSAG02_NODE_2291_length_9203_cov_4.256920_6_plen_106_part_00